MAADRQAGGDSAERRLTAEHVAARALIDASTFDEAAPKILQAICEALGWEHGALWTVDREADALRCTQIWTSGRVSLPEFDAISRRTLFQRGVGLPGRVWATAEPAWIPDVVQDTNFPRAPAAAREGLHAAFGFPIRLRGDVLSVMEFFSRDIREPDAALLSMLTAVGNQIGLFIDRRRAQEELDRFFTLSLDMLCIAGFDGYFKRVNPAWGRILGYSDEELLSRPYMELIHPDDRDSTIAAAGNLTRGQEIIHFENRYRHKDGTYRWLLWSSTPFPEQQVVYAAARDVTERKAADETMALLVKELEIAKRRAEEATEAKSAFLANMSHEIRTPLNAILGMAALAMQTRLTAEQREYLATLKDSGESLLTIVNDILDFSKIEARRLDLERAEFDLREAAGDAAKLLAPRAGDKNIELACHIAPDVPETLLGDAGRLRQVLLNVMGNAVKFTNEGEVVLDVSVHSSRPDRATLHFAVSDTGIGIPKEKQQQIFSAFTQVDSSTTRRYGGTGLGLAIAQHMVQLMDGRMWVESELGRGSTLHFTAVFDRPQPAPPPSVRMPQALEGLRVLVVDDNATNRLILEEMLASWHMRPTAVGDAASAMTALGAAVAADERFDVVISDCQMPDVDGFMLARRIQQDRQLARTPFVMLTSMARSDDAARCRKAGVGTYLTKPVKHSDLLEALATIFNVSVRRDRPETASPVPSDVPRRPLRVLVAEDNEVNRSLITKLLQKRGHTVKAVENGREAVDAAASTRTRRFDVLLMDLQMPEMGGFEATQAIRAREATSGGHLPIVALTAHAMQGDRERCLEAGMDGYLSKPIDVNELTATVEGFDRSGADRQAPAQRADGILDERAALAHAGGDRQLLKSAIKVFRASYPGTLRRMKAALRKRDGDALRIAAHGLKGSVATVGSTATAAVAAALERQGRTERFDDSERTYASLREHLARLDEAFLKAGLARRTPKTRQRGRK
jgi:PAS domain S-box-containing protein